MYLGVDVGGTKTLIGVLNDDGEIRESLKFPTPEKYDIWLEELKKHLGELKHDDFHAAGVAVPGMVDRERGIALKFGNLHWHNVAIQADTEKIFHCPVVLENDANLAALSEAMLLKHYRKVLYVTVSTGIGTGYIFDQTIEPGMADSEGGQMMLEHHGRMEKWEHFASGSAIVRRFGKRAEDIHDEKTWKRISHDLALGFIELIAVGQPDVIVIGGSVGTYLERYKPFLEAELKKFHNPMTPIPPIRKAERPNEAVVYGCYDLAKSVYGKNR